MGTYIECYIYDEVGNILSLRYHGTGPTYQGWTQKYFYDKPSLLEIMKYSNCLSRISIGSTTEHYCYEGSVGWTGNMTSMPNLAIIK